MQGVDGSWGYFHTLKADSGKPITTEQTLLRLEILGYSIADVPIQKAVTYISDCLTGSIPFPDGEEEGCDWSTFRVLILATWIKKFTDENDVANRVAALWASVIAKAFSSGAYSHADYTAAYQSFFN